MYNSAVLIEYADVAELVDALDSGSSGSNPVEVQVLSSAPQIQMISLHVLTKYSNSRT